MVLVPIKKPGGLIRVLLCYKIKLSEMLIVRNMNLYDFRLDFVV